MFFQKSTLIAAATMLAMSPLVANAHMIMKSPVPYGTPAQTKDKAPLDPSGSNFPCRNPSYTVNKMNDWPVGSSQILSFEGTAVHGGGSCQISVTTDKAPTKASKWKVIYSMEGGCPSAASGNLAQDDGTTFPFTIPKELPDGEMTMAWTWFNKVGNREMYMYCAPVKVSGGAKDTSAYESLPDMAVANLASEGTCRTTEGSDYTFESPGQYKMSGGTGPFKSLCGGQAAIGGDAPVAPSPQQPATPSQATANPGIPTSAPVVPQVSALPSTLRTIVTVTAPVGTAPTGSPGYYTAPSAKPTAQSSQPVAPSAPVPSAPASPSPAPGNTTGQACSTDGAIVCRGDSEFGLCNHGTVVFQAVAQGTTCKNGAVTKRDAYLHRNMRTVV